MAQALAEEERSDAVGIERGKQKRDDELGVARVIRLYLKAIDVQPSPLSRVRRQKQRDEIKLAFGVDCGLFSTTFRRSYTAPTRLQRVLK